MASVGIVGGLGPESTIDYYRRILDAWKGVDPSTAPSIVIDSLDVQRALRLVEHDRSALVEYLLASVCRLSGAGVDFAAMTANTPHIVFDDLAARSPVPLVSIVEVCAEDARQRGLRRLALLGTRFTMDAPFYPEVCGRHGIVAILPNETDRTWVHQRYVGQLLEGEFLEETREEFTSLVSRLRRDEGSTASFSAGRSCHCSCPNRSSRASRPSIPRRYMSPPSSSVDATPIRGRQTPARG